MAIVQGFAADAIRGAVVARAGSVGIHGDRLCHEPSTVLHGVPHIAAWLPHCRPGGSCQNQSHTIGSASSAVFARPWAQVMDGDLLKVVSWYDNEWGYSCRTADLIAKIGKFN